MNWLKQTQQALRQKEINLNGAFCPSEKIVEAVQDLVAASTPRIKDILEGLDNKKAVKLEGFFQSGLRKAAIRTIKGATRGVKKGYVDEVNISAPENLEVIANEYRSAIDFVLSLSKLSAGTFSKAATITPFWNGEELQKTLSTPSIRKYLEEKGIEMSEEEVEKVFTRSVRMHFAVGNISDPLDAIGRVAEHVNKTLSTQKIKEYLEEMEVEMSEEEVEKVFTRSVRMYFAVGNISDPLKACLRYVIGSLAVGGGHVTSIEY